MKFYNVHGTAEQWILDLVFARRPECQVCLVLDFIVDVAGDADIARLRQLFQSCCDIHAVAIDIFAVDDDVAEVDAHAKGDAPITGHVLLALGDAALHFCGALDGVDHARELDQAPSPASLMTRP